MHVTVIDDEKVLGSKIKKKLEGQGYAVSDYYGYREFMKKGDAKSEFYIIDVSLGDGSGFSIIEWLRKVHLSVAPILIISGYGDSEKVVYGLNIWADDYMVKPFVPEELIARIRALMRRPKVLLSAENIYFKNIIFDPETRETQIWAHKMYLTRKESLILELFLREQGMLIKRDRLITYIWGWQNLEDVSDNTINVTLSKLRKKIGPDFSLKTLYNHGYILE